MSISNTSLTFAVGLLDQSIRLTSVAGVSKGQMLRIDDEMMRVLNPPKGLIAPVLRGQDGTVQQAHPAGAIVVIGSPQDYGPPARGVETTYSAPGTPRVVRSLSASGAIPLPSPGSDLVVILNGTSVLTMTLESPTAELTGSLLIVIASGTAAHTIAYSPGLGSAGEASDLLTFSGNGQSCMAFIAVNSVWLPFPSPLGSVIAIGAEGDFTLPPPTVVITVA